MVSPRRTSLVRTWLYRNRLAVVILTASIGFASFLSGGTLHAQELVQQYGRKAADLGPRALGLVQLSSKGKARLIPIVIMMDGKFFDAGSYKATPVPMALDFGVIYEGFKTGVSQGIFTITQPGQLNHNWIAEGTWLPEGVKAPEKTKKYAPPVIEDDDTKSDRPVLHRRKEGAADKDESKPAAGTTPTTAPTSTPTGSPPSSSAPSTTESAPSTTSTSPSGSTSATSAPSGSASGSSPSATKDKDAAKPSSSSTSRTYASDEEPINDPNRPILRRGKPDPNAHHEPFVNFDEAAETAKPASGKSVAAPASDSASIQTFAAISDAKGPDPRPYTYDLKPAEEAIYRNKMLDLAATLVRTNGRPSPPAQASSLSKGSIKRAAAAKARDQFEEARLRVFDLSSSNEPVLVLSARTAVPPAGATGAQVPKEITLVARTDLEGELQKLFFAQTDSHHLDVSPRMELIDAVDADGDGRGELLFRQTSDAGSTYAIYRVTADNLWPLYEGTP
jgi:hypothetical protein